MPFHNGDEIVKIDDVPITNYGQINVELARKADKTITVVGASRRTKREGQDRGRADHGGSQSDAAVGIGDEDGRGHGDPSRSPAVEAGIQARRSLSRDLPAIR